MEQDLWHGQGLELVLQCRRIVNVKGFFIEDDLELVPFFGSIGPCLIDLAVPWTYSKPKSCLPSNH